MSHLATCVKASKSAEEVQSRKRKKDSPETTSKRHCHNSYTEFNDDNMAHAGSKTTGSAEDGNDTERQFGDTSVDWDFHVNLNLVWDQFIADQIAGAADG